ncbi:MAG TPA: peptide chain release factor N(5)-glutamine methyltransferase [Methylophilaceae bacterium]
MKQISQYLATAQQQLIQTLKLEASTAGIEAQSLLRVVLPTATRAWLITHGDDSLSVEQQTTFDALLKRRLNGEPVAYIVGIRDFYGFEFKVSPEVLIPRADTETLVETALAKIPIEQPCEVLDMGTGTGAIAITIALLRPQAQVIAIDISPTALQIARENMHNLAANNLILLQSDWFSGLNGERFDVIVSNPPYIADQDMHLTQGDLRFEPLQALASGKDGLDSICHIITGAPQYLNPHGWLMLEHGYDQAEQVQRLLFAAGFSEVVSTPDLAGILRVTAGKKQS